jgi:hypothetical protein
MLFQPRIVNSKIMFLFAVARRRVATLILAALGGAIAARADEFVIPHRQDRLPNPPYSPAEALRRMTVPEGFTVSPIS